MSPPKQGMIFVSANLQIPRSELTLAFARSSGPGGQNINKINSKVQLRWCPMESTAINAKQLELIEEKLKNRLSEEGVLQVSSDRFRNQARNIEDAEEKLIALLKKTLTRRKKRVKTKIPRSAKESRLKDKRKHAEKKQARKYRG